MPVSCPILKDTAASQMATEATNQDHTQLTKAMTSIKAAAQNRENSGHNYEDGTANVAAIDNATANTINGNSSNNPDAGQCDGNQNRSLMTTSLHSTPAGRDRKGTSYVWNYCEKLSRHTVRCRLCHKIMSFHGTANIITHLQRRHNIMGDNVIQSTFPLMRRGHRNEDILNGNGNGNVNGNGVDNGVGGATGDGNGGVPFDPMMITDLMDDMTEENDHLNAENGHRFSNSSGNSNRKSINSTSVVWRYCKRISQDQVRCCFCKKYLSYQGTSNLQRHLHRMHGVVTQGRCPKANLSTSSSNNNNNRHSNNIGGLSTAMENGDGAGVGGGAGGSDISGHVYYPVIKEENIRLPNNLDFIWQFCSHHDVSPKVKCNMCDMSFMTKDTLAIAKHLTMIHGVETSHLHHARDDDGTGFMNPGKWRHRNTLDFENSNDGHYEDYTNLNKWNKIVTEKNDVVSPDHHQQQQQQQQQQQRHPVIYGENPVKKDDSLFYDELIDEERDDHFPTNRYDEEPFDPSILENLPEINPLSVRSSSGSHSPDIDSERVHHSSGMFLPLRLPYGRFATSGDPQFLKLQKDCLRMETEYYREKAGFFRMQKHLTALQAKKVRLELEQLTRSQSNPQNPCSTSNSSIFTASGE